MPCLLTDLRKVQLSVGDHFQRIFNDHEKIKLEMRGMELEKRDAQSECERRMLAEEIEKVSLFGLDCCHNFSYIS
jgi:hypothetical protein